MQEADAQKAILGLRKKKEAVSVIETASKVIIELLCYLTTFSFLVNLLDSESTMTR